MADIVAFPDTPAITLTDSDIAEVRYALDRVLNLTGQLASGEARDGIRLEAEYALALLEDEDEEG